MQELEHAGFVPEQNPDAEAPSPARAALQEKVADAQMRYLAARQFPRDIVRVENAIRLACQRYELAQTAQYALPIEGQLVRGPSIRLAEVLAQTYGNLDVGKEIVGSGKDDRGRWSDVRVYALDLETGLRVHEVMRIHHLRVLKDKRTGVVVESPVHDPAELERLFAAHAAKRLRECIFRAIPRDLTAKALAWCSETVRSGEMDANGRPMRPLIDRIKGMVVEFDRMGVRREQLEAYVGCRIEVWTPDQFEDMLAVYRTLRDGLASADEYFGDPAAGAGITTARMRAQAQARRARSQAADTPRGYQPYGPYASGPGADDGGFGGTAF